MDVQVGQYADRAGGRLIAGLLAVALCPAAAAAQFELTLRATTQPAAEEPATRPAIAVQPTTRPATELKKLVGELASADSDVRDGARRALMGLTRPDLVTLQQIVRAGPKLTTAQVSLLRDVVTHVFLATEPYAQTRQALLGVRDLAAVKVVAAPDEQNDQDLEQDKQQQAQNQIVLEGNGVGGVLIFTDPVHRIGSGDIGVVVSERMPGFCAYRHLDNGDVVLAIKGEREFRPRTVWDFQVMIRSREPGDKITLEVLRRGRILDVTLKLDAYPECAVDPRTATKELEEFRRTREEAAEDYWEKNFGGLVGDGIF